MCFQTKEQSIHDFLVDTLMALYLPIILLSFLFSLKIWLWGKLPTSRLDSFLSPSSSELSLEDGSLPHSLFFKGSFLSTLQTGKIFPLSSIYLCCWSVYVVGLGT